jgi:uncharacterized protein (DUF1501 family)
MADWPGVRANDLYEKRDLKPTTDLRAVLKATLRDYLSIEEHALATDIFPDSERVIPVEGLLA